MSDQKIQGWTVSSPLEREQFAWLDKLAEPSQKAWQGLFSVGKPGRYLKNLLNGVPFRHRIHPALIIWPLGAWTAGALLDVLDLLASRKGDHSYRSGADASVAFGLVGAIPTALAGWADWVDTYDHQRRVGMAHALLNVTAIGLYAASVGLRVGAPERRTAARTLAGLGYLSVSGGGVLGGEMVYNLGVNVPFLLYPKPPTQWVDLLASEELPAGKPVVIDVERVPVMLLRQDDQIVAVESWCPHAGGPLNEGKFEDGVVECPWHQSRFRLADGAPLQGPASTPLRTFEVREQDGRISVRPSFEGQDYPPSPGAPEKVVTASE